MAIEVHHGNRVDPRKLRQIPAGEYPGEPFRGPVPRRDVNPGCWRR